MKKTKRCCTIGAASCVQQETPRVESVRSQDFSRNKESTRDSFTSMTSGVTVADEGVGSEVTLSANSYFANKSAQGKATRLPKDSIEGVYSRGKHACRSQSLYSEIAERVSGEIGIRGASDTDDDFPGSLCEALRTHQLGKADGRGDEGKLGSGPSPGSIPQDHQSRRSQQSPNDTNPASTFSFSLSDIMECVEIV